MNIDGSTPTFSAPSYIVSYQLTSPPILHYTTLHYTICCEKDPKMSTTRYKDPIPEGVCVFTTLDEAAKIQQANPYAIFYPENNGHYAKDPDGTVVAVASDEMCEEIDRRNAELEAKIAAGEKLTDEYAV
ncbi:hypothetical protein BDV40DRAFT_122521 [Aspergillus tamarii]|uniref:Uncharacterized protein n=1 Tax=Aspergillus tamarii TaxID=41984 RepID=A0A5N6UZD9_ASPTM|nr:hypothetical protein BDV40DRAFT_122521 [Aspergillus tamarii]